MELAHYLNRIRYEGSVEPNLSTLRQIQHQHLLHIPYENVDIQLGHAVDFDMHRIFNKLVTNNRGGWCYEMNGLLGWALAEMGYAVRRMSGAVMRAAHGDTQLGNHLILEVLLDHPYLVDVGLGDGIREPIVIAQAQHTQNGLAYSLEHMNDGYWRFHNHPFSNTSSFDFLHKTADETELVNTCQRLQTDPESSFKKLLIVHRFTREGIQVQIGKISTFIDATGKTTQVIDDLDSLHDHLDNIFGLKVNLTSIWPKICDAHEQLMSADKD